jgi:hypothetical protein
MNYGNPHSRDSFLGPIGNRRMGKDREEEQIFGPGKPFPRGRQPIFGPGKPFPRDQETIYRPMTAGYDGGNTRPRGPDGRPLPFNQYPSRTVPVPIMDYTGNMTAQAYKPGYPTEMDYLSDPFREIDPASLYFPENPNDNMNDPMDDDMFQGYGRGPLYFG